MILTLVANLWESSFKNNRFVQITTVSSILLNVATWVLLYVKISPFAYLTETGTIPLHYNLYFGIDVFGPWYSVFSIAGLGLLALVFNTVFAYALYVKERVVSYFLIGTHVLVNVIALAASFFTILLNS